MIAGMIMAVMLVVQPGYAVNKHFNIHVTISSFSMELLESDGQQIYQDWPITVPPNGAVTMTAQHAVMVSITGDVPANGVDIFSHVDNNDGWNVVLPDNGLAANDFALEVASVMDIVNDAPAGFMPITLNTQAPVAIINNPGGMDAVATFLIYKFHAGPNYTKPDADLDVKIEAVPVP